jgi:hypothetical protein
VVLCELLPYGMAVLRGRVVKWRLQFACPTALAVKSSGFFRDFMAIVKVINRAKPWV